jgi:hypothetical protein
VSLVILIDATRRVLGLPKLFRDTETLARLGFPRPVPWSVVEERVRDLVVRAERAELIAQADDARARIRAAHAKLFRRHVRHDRPIAELESDLRLVEMASDLLLDLDRETES